jgi:hypothetical protein
MIITYHGEARLRGRLGFPKRAVKRIATKAVREGRPRQECRGDIRQYLDNV